ncbi:MAG: 7-carboxy-7-deazaguanine synthase QueE [Candidatus Omnitrophota bacterium]|nr:7-carboxy-7-deazaguanine synthase QueE [Candidatus Omnitrophota bacterium]
MRTRGKITEVFSSVQGEGLYFGEEQIFVRFFGCNLKCKFCDTHLDRFTEYEPEELLQELKLYKNGHATVSFTGGEPLLQKYFLKAILKLTRKEGYKNYLETNGILHSALEDVIDDVDIVAMDLKLPSSTGLKDFWHHHHRFLKVASKKETFLKMVICQDTNEEDLKEGLRLIKEVNKFLILVLQPNSYEEYEPMIEKLERFKDIARDNHITACVIPQLHKKIGLK